MNVAKGPTTTRVPDWDRVFEELLERQESIARVAAAVWASGVEPFELTDDLLQLGMQLKYVDQMRRITARENFSRAA